MNVESRLYRIGGHTVRVRLEQPWTFKALTEQQLELVARLKAGEDIGIESVPADRQEQLSVNDALMGKEAMTRAVWDTLDETERSEYRHALDFLQYAPFEVAEGEPLFTLTVHAEAPSWLEEGTLLSLEASISSPSETGRFAVTSIAELSAVVAPLWAPIAVSDADAFCTDAALSVAAVAALTAEAVLPFVEAFPAALPQPETKPAITPAVSRTDKNRSFIPL